MKIKKRTAMIASFTIGALLFATTALADITNKSGYEQLKDSVKLTSHKIANEFDNATIDMTYVVKSNGKVIEYSNDVTKLDRKNNASESIYKSEKLNGKNYTRFNYNDSKTSIYLGEDGTYYVTEFPEARKVHHFDNPFEEEEAKDVERIIDAIVGNLADHVIVEDNPDGSKELSGALTEMQIPALVNAITSLQVKQEFGYGDHENKLPKITKDVYVKQITGAASINQEGILEDILGTVTIIGKDDKGTEHDITVEVLCKIEDINSTKVSKPNMSDKKVIKEVSRHSNGKISNPQKFEGIYKNDIILEENGKYVKAGERTLEITKIDEKGINGRYYEEIRPGFEDKVTKVEDFTFHAKPDNDEQNLHYTVTGDDGKEGYIYLDEYVGKINFHLNKRNYDSSFSPVLE